MLRAPVSCVLWVAKPSCPAWSWSDGSPALARGALSVVVLWRFADWRIVTTELVLALRGGGAFSVVKLSL